MPTKEEIYDAEIHPLMHKILEICEQHSIAMIASFQIGIDEASNSAYLCTSQLLFEKYDPPDCFIRAACQLQIQPKPATNTPT